MKKVALITGGSRGIGLGIARELAKNGFDLAINGVRDEADIAAPMEELRGLGAEVLYCQGSVASAEARGQVLEKVRARYGRLNVLVNNAGVAPRERKDILETTAESFRHVLSVNLEGAFFLTQAAANWMIGQRQDDAGFSGCIITVSSVSATVASVNRGEYCIAKAGLGMLTELFAARLGEYDIPVYEIRPGIVQTDMTAGVKEKYDRLIEEGICVQKRWGRPDDVGKAAAALALGSFPYSTGQVVMVDGGMTIPRL